jgi:hypothetical protein
MALIIPKEYISVLNKIRNLPDSAVDELVQALTSSPIASNAKELTARIAERVQSIQMDDLGTIVDGIYVLYHVREFSELNRNSFLKELFASVQRNARPPLTESEAPSIQGRFKRLLNIKTLNSISKAIALQRDGERLYCDATIISDMRPVFGPDVESKPVAAVIRHTLNLSYHEAGTIGHKEFFIVLDEQDLEALQKIIGRAQRKSETLEHVLSDSGIPRLGV